MKRPGGTTTSSAALRERQASGAHAALLAFVFMVAVMFAIAAMNAVTLAAERTAAEVLAEREQVQTELNQLEGQFNANTNRLSELEAEFNSLESRKEVAANNMLRMESEAENLSYKKDALDVESPQLDAEFESLQVESANYAAQCSGELPEAQYNSCVSWMSDLNARNSDYNNRANDWNARSNSLQAEVEVLEQEWMAAEQEMTSATQQQEMLIQEGVMLEADNEALADRGVVLEQRLTELDLELATLEEPDTPCDPNDFSSFEAFEECMRGVFGEGGGPKAEAPTESKQEWNPFSEGGKKKSGGSGEAVNPFAGDSSVVKPDWDGRGDSGGDAAKNPFGG